MTTTNDPTAFTCVWCESTATNRATFPTCSTRCRDAATAYRERTLRLWRPER